MMDEIRYSDRKFNIDDITTIGASRPDGMVPNRFTRLICARIYLLGLFGSLTALYRLLGLPYRGDEASVGYDRRLALFHSFQSFMLSIFFLIPLSAIYYFSRFLPEAAFFIAAVILFFKVAVVNFWLSRRFFNEKSRQIELEMPFIGKIARHLRDALLPKDRLAQQNVIFFDGLRPFIGYGSEINSWTLVIDTTNKSRTFDLGLNAAIDSSTVTPADLYRAIYRRVQDLKLHDINISAALFYEGDAVDAIKGEYSGKYHKPPTRLPLDVIQEIENRSTEGRRYMMLQFESAERDLIATQFIRFYQSAKLIFCEFASLVVPPGKRRLNFIDRLFELHPIAYAAAGVLAFLIIGVLGTAFSPVVEPLIWLKMPHLLELMRAPERLLSFFNSQFQSGYFFFRIIGLSIFFTFLILFWRFIKWVLVTVGIYLGLKKNFGVAASYREKFSQGLFLSYYDLQEVIRFLKTQEKILTNSLIDCLDHFGIDTSDLRENITAFINQGVINTGEIRGNLSAKIKSIVFRRPRKSTQRRRVSYARSQ